jgi:hypothetical protein
MPVLVAAEVSDSDKEPDSRPFTFQVTPTEWTFVRVETRGKK